jgi:hypothetical protein
MVRNHRLESCLLIILGLSLSKAAKNQGKGQLEALVSLNELRFLQVNDAIFESSVDVDVLLNMSTINDASTVNSVMSDTFKTSYNSLAEMYDDPLNRRVENVTVSSTAKLPQRSRNLQSPSSLRYRFKVIGSCRACPPNTPLLVSFVGIR